MFENPSLNTRVGIGKAIGFLFGLLGFIFMTYFLPDVGWMLRWGVLLWYTAVGAMIGVFGVFTYHPVLKMPWPWWLRAPLLGAVMNFILVLFAFDDIQSMMTSLFGESGILSSPFWLAAEGAIIGLVIDYLATRFGGEGKETVGK
ncbi:MAG: hypothetical protein OSA95_06090 [Opitutales bacterium]|nr:hypothetical protein [Opitutales bacterium]